MPTKHSRIAVTRDPELSEAIERARPFFDGAPVATIVRNLALRGAQEVLAHEERRLEAMQKLADWSTTRTGLDWDVLARTDREAWGYDEDD